MTLHSCDHHTKCGALESGNVVSITPVISRSSEGVILPETGAGSVGGDFTQLHPLDFFDPKAVSELVKLCTKEIQDVEILSRVINFISTLHKFQQQEASLTAVGLHLDDEPISLQQFIRRLADMGRRKGHLNPVGGVSAFSKDEEDKSGDVLPRNIVRPQSVDLLQTDKQTQQFPYSRHSSYHELCHLISTLKPLDVYPCIVDEVKWNHETSIEHLFGHLCIGTTFAHDEEMKARIKLRAENLQKRADLDLQHTESVRAYKTHCLESPGDPSFLSSGETVQIATQTPQNNLKRKATAATTRVPSVRTSFAEWLLRTPEQSSPAASDKH